MLVLVAVLSLTLTLVESSNNGLALTPPMGWLDWQRFRCNTDCDNDPDNCISERLFMTMADLLVSEGYKDVGYEYVSIDDCWLAKNRDKDGRLQPDPKRFPNGMKALADYVHSKGLKFGIYEDFGVKTCAGFPGSEFYMELDAQTFAAWGVDFLKFDGCNSDPRDSEYGYPAMAKFLQKTGRDILYSCEWPLYQATHGIKPNFTAVRDACNFWRIYDDIGDLYDSVMSIIDYVKKDYNNFTAFAGPGGWNDPDDLIIGDFALSYEQQRTQMAFWSLWAAPLFMSNDLRDIRPESKEILQNKNLIAINQDKMGIQGRFIKQIDGIDFWRRSISPLGSYALLYYHHGRGSGTPVRVKQTLSDMGLTNSPGYSVTETFTGKSLGTYKPGDVFNCTVNPTGVFMATALPLR